MKIKAGLENIVTGMNWIKHKNRTIPARIKVRLKLEVGHSNCATSVVMLGHILGGKQNVLHAKRNIETVDVKAIFARCCKSAAEKRPKGSIKVVWQLLDNKDQASDSESEESEIESICTLNTPSKIELLLGLMTRVLILSLTQAQQP